MRIIAGKFGSQSIAAPKGWKTRPTSDRLRETLFNIVAPRIEGAVFADLFAGTGAAGLEALSRGARQVYFAENAKSPLETLRNNLNKLKIGPEAQVEPAGSLPLLRRLAREGVRLDIVFLDPPYSDHAAYQDTLQLLANEPLLSADSVVIAEHSSRVAVSAGGTSLQAYRSLRQGEAALTFFHMVST